MAIFVDLATNCKPTVILTSDNSKKESNRVSALTTGSAMPKHTLESGMEDCLMDWVHTSLKTITKAVLLMV